MATTIKVRRDTAANWTSVNPVLNSGEIGLETDTRYFKIGDGVTAWTSLAYSVSGSEGEATTWTQGHDANGNSLNNLLLAYFSSEHDNGNSGSSATIDWATNGQKQKITLNSASVTLNFTDPPGPCNLVLKLIQDATGSRMVGTWDTDIKWAQGAAPTLTTNANAVDILSCYFDGTSYYCQVGFDFS